MIIRKIINTIFLVIIFCCVFWSVFTEFRFKNFAESNVSIVPSNIRVGLMREIPSISFCVQGDYVIAEGYHGDLIVAATAGQKYTVTKTDEGLALFEGDRLLGVFSNNIAVKKVITEVAILNADLALSKRTSGAGLAIIDGSYRITGMAKNFSSYSVISAKGMSELKASDELHLVNIIGDQNRRYRGEFEFRSDENGITVINTLPIEEYLYGVVPCEMPAEWPKEALKAQAIASRTYALYSLGKYSLHGFDVLATQLDQVYKGYDYEDERTTNAVKATEGQVLVFDGQPILATFFSSSGGFTGNSEDIWKQYVPYLRAKKDIYDYNEKHYNWSVTMTPEELALQFTSRGYPYSYVTDIEEIERDATGSRIKVMRITGLCPEGQFKQEEIYNADRVRFALGLKSSLFSMEKTYDENGRLVLVTFNGSGWGHGVGMSQHGAKGMAEKGYSYYDILNFYYTGVEIDYNYGGW